MQNNSTPALVELKNIKTFFFVDETKFFINDGNLADEIYYIAVRVEIKFLHTIRNQYNLILKKYGLLNGYHSNKVFKEKSPNAELMEDFCNLITINKLKCYCFKYSKDFLYEKTKTAFKDYNNGDYDFDNPEFQALWYFLKNFMLNIEEDNTFKPKGIMYFDRNVYGRSEIEGKGFTNSDLIERMVYVSRKKIDLIGLPDYFGFIFRKVKIYKNSLDKGLVIKEKSELTVNSENCIMRIVKSGLFIHLDFEHWQIHIDQIIPVIEKGNLENL